MCPSVRDRFYRLRKNEYGPTKEWVVLKTSDATAGAAKRTKEQKKKKAKKAKKSKETASTEL